MSSRPAGWCPVCLQAGSTWWSQSSSDGACGGGWSDPNPATEWKGACLVATQPFRGEVGAWPRPCGKNRAGPSPNLDPGREVDIAQAQSDCTRGSVPAPQGEGSMALPQPGHAMGRWHCLVLIWLCRGEGVWPDSKQLHGGLGSLEAGMYDSINCPATSPNFPTQREPRRLDA